MKRVASAKVRFTSLAQKELPKGTFAHCIDDTSHSHTPLLEKMHVVNGTAAMDNYALVEESLHYTGAFPTEGAKQFGYLTMAYIDGNTIPFLWYYASRFALFDNHFQTIVGPSSKAGAQKGRTGISRLPNETPAPSVARIGEGAAEISASKPVRS